MCHRGQTEKLRGQILWSPMRAEEWVGEWRMGGSWVKGELGSGQLACRDRPRGLSK